MHSFIYSFIHLKMPIEQNFILLQPLGYRVCWQTGQTSGAYRFITQKDNKHNYTARKCCQESRRWTHSGCYASWNTEESRLFWLFLGSHCLSEGCEVKKTCLCTHMHIFKRMSKYSQECRWWKIYKWILSYFCIKTSCMRFTFMRIQSNGSGYPSLQLDPLDAMPSLISQGPVIESKWPKLSLIHFH